MTEWFIGAPTTQASWHGSAAGDEEERELTYLMNDIGPLLYVFGRKLDPDWAANSKRVE